MCVCFFLFCFFFVVLSVIVNKQDLHVTKHCREQSTKEVQHFHVVMLLNHTLNSFIVPSQMNGLLLQFLENLCQRNTTPQVYTYDKG